MRRTRVFLLFLFGFLLLSSSPAMAQFPNVSAEEVKAWMEGKRTVVLIDARLPDEYQAGHIPGAINIPAERMKLEAARLPKDKTIPIIFYCRGTG
ncbi:MAG TPA: rhodanese-like domain-containing protein [Nitrospirota bacterium]|nr:rhodanese-like domain-containing protein [Nitrospirota bacterium]